MSAFLAESATESKAGLVQVHHNHHLDDETILQMAGVRLNPDVSLGDIRRRLETSGLFSTVKVWRTPGVLHILVNEKLTWMALPYFSSNSSQTLYGLALAKSSAFGQNSSILARYQFGSINHEASFLIRDEYFLNTLWIAGLNVDFEDSLHSVYEGRDLSRRFRNRYWGSCAQGGLHLDIDSSIVLNTCYERHSFEEVNLNFRSGTQISHKATFETGHFSSNEGLSRGQMVRAYVEFSNPASDLKFIKGGASGQVSAFLKNNFNWIVKPKFELGTTGLRYQLFELGGVKLRGFPGQQFRDGRYFLVQNDFFLTAVEIWKMIIRPLIFADWAHVQQESRVGAGMGINVYFRQVAIPALQLFSGYGFNPNGFSVTLAIGPQF